MLRHSSLAMAAALVTLFAGSIGAPPARAQGAAALSGQVTSAEEGAMEGVIVNARKDGSTVTVSVVTNEQGRYSFPAGRLEAGHYALSTRATGYDLEGPTAADVASGNPATVDLKLRKTRNLSKQLTNAEWMMSMPGSDDDKLQLLNCVSCHTLERIVKSTHDADEFVQVVARMQGYAQVSQPIKPQRRVDQTRAADPERFRKFAQYLATINLSQVPRWEYAAQGPAARERPRHPCGHHRVRPAAADHRAPRRGALQRLRLVHQFRRAIYRPARSQDRPAQGVRPARAQAGLPDRLARSQAGPGRHPVVRHDVSGRARQVRSQVREIPDFPGLAGAQQGRHPAQHADHEIRRRRQDVDQRRRPIDHPAAGCEQRKIREFRSAGDAAGRTDEQIDLRHRRRIQATIST